MTLNPITWSDIRSFFALHKLDPMAWEVDAVCDLDDAYLTSRMDDRVGVVKKAGGMRGRVAKPKK